MSNFQVIYLTGAPAAGKSSLTRRLRQLVDPIEVWEFGERLTAYLNETRGSDMDQTELRRQSAKAAPPEAIAAVDDMLINFVTSHRAKSHVVIDSHPVTKEHYGYRVTPYSLKRFAELQPTQIWMLYTDPSVALQRIGASPEGRPNISVEEARFHTQMQASVAITYGMSLGLPVHLFDSALDPGELAQQLAERIKAAAKT
jgi:adenylate kinase